MCLILLKTLMADTITRNFFLVYLVIGIVIYLAFGRNSSNLGRGILVQGHEASPMELPQKED